MANRYDIIHIDFQANARGANAAIESIRKEAEESSKKITQLKQDIADALKAGDTDKADLLKVDLRSEDKRLRQLTQAQNELIKGMRVLDQAVKQFNDGSLQEMNAAFQKSANNAAKLAQSKMETGSQSWREMGAIIQETEQNYARMQRDTDQLIEHLQNGGTVFRKTIEDEKKGLQDLLQVLPYMGMEYRKAEEQLKFLTKTTDDMLIKERQLKGEIVTTDDARREALKTTEEGAEVARRQGEQAEKEISWRTKVAEVLDKQRQSQEQLAKQSAQEVADNIERLQEYEDVIEGARLSIQQTNDKIQGKVSKADRLEQDAEIARQEYLKLQKEQKAETNGDTQATKDNTEATEKNNEAKKKGAEATEKSTESKKKKTKATKEDTQAKKENAEASKEEAKEEDEVTKAKKEWEKADKKAQRARREANNAIDEGNKKIAEENALIEDTTNKRTRLEAQNEKAAANNKRNQENLAKTIEMERQNAEATQDAELKKIQAQGLTIKQLETVIALYKKQHDEEMEANTDVWREKGMEIERLSKILNDWKGEAKLQMMTDRIGSIGNLSAAAFEETKKFWQAMSDGADKNDPKLKSIQGNLEVIAEEERQRTEAARVKEADKLLNKGYLTMSEEEIRKSIAAAREYQQTLKPNEEHYRTISDLIAEAENYMKNFGEESLRTARKQAESDQMMQKQLEQGTALTESALKAQQQYWQRLIDDPKTAAESIDEYKKELEKVIDLQTQQTETTRNERAGRLNGNLGNYSETEIREAIEAGKQLVATFKTGDTAADELAKKIVAAEEYLKDFGVEAERTAVREAKAIEEANKKRKEMNNLMVEQWNNSRNTMSESALKAHERYWQQLIDDPKTASEELEKYRKNLETVQAFIQHKAEENLRIEGESALAFFRGDTSNASANTIKEQADALKKYRDSLPREEQAEVIAEINGYLLQTGQVAEKAAANLMSVGQAMKLATDAGKDGFEATEAEIKSAIAALEKAIEDEKKFIADYKKSGGKDKSYENELKERQEALRKLKIEQDNVGMSHKRMNEILKEPASAESLNELRAAIKRAKAELMGMEGSLNKNKQAYAEMAATVKKAEFQLKSMENQAKGTANAFEKAWSRLKTYVTLYVGAAAAMQKIFATTEDLKVLSDKMGEVRKTTDLSAEAVGRLSENLAKLDVRTPLTELMEISAAAGQLGLKSEEDIMGFTQAANMLMIALPEMGKEAATEMMRVAIATGEVDKIRKQMEEGLVEGSNATAVAMTKIASTIDRLRASSASTAPEITDFVKRVGAVGAQSGITIDQVAALGSTISSLGLRIEMSATALSRMIPAIRRNAFELSQAIGVSPEAVRSLFDAGRGMEAVLMILQRIKDQNMDADSIEKMLGMGGMQEIMKDLNQQGARAGIVFAGLSQNVDELRKQLVTASQAYEENTAIQREFERMNETTAAKWERLKNKIEEAFVTDQSQRWLGWIIEKLRQLVDLLVGNNGLSAAVFTVMTLFGFLKVSAGAALWGAIAAGCTKVIDLFKNWRLAIELVTLKLKEMTAAQWANVFLAIAAGVAMLIYKLQEMAERASVVANEMAKLDAEILKETKVTDGLFRVVNRTNAELEHAKERLEEVKKANEDTTEAENKLKKASADHAASIREINSKYGQYLGYMLSETSSALQLAKARDLINAKLRETITLKQREVALGNIEQEYGGRVNKKAASVEQTLQTFYGNDSDRAARVSIAISEAAQKYANDSKKYQEAVKKILADNKIQRDVAESYMDTFEGYREAIEEYSKQENAVMNRFEARANAAKKDSRQKAVAALNSILGDWKQLVDDYRKAEGEEKEKLAVEVYKQQRSYANAVANNAEYFENDKRKAVFDRNLKNMQTYEKGLRDVAGEAIRTVDAMERAESKITNIDFTNGGDSNKNPWGGQLPSDSTAYADMNATALVNRRKQMKDFVNAIQTDTDVQSVLKEDAALKKAIENGMASDMRTVVEWYNTERLKIQDELYKRHLTNTGDWLDPKKSRESWRKQLQTDLDNYLKMLDAFYTRRKAEIQEAGNDEGLSEAEIRNRQLANDTEWQQRRLELQQIYLGKREKVAKDEVTAIMAILAEMDEDTPEMVEKLIGKSLDKWKILEEKAPEMARRLESKFVSGVSQSMLKMQQIVHQQMKAIEDIIDKERPFNGIAKSLKENLVTMDILTADMREEYRQLMKEGKDTTDFNRRQHDEEMKRTTFLLGEAEHAYTTTVEDVMRRMGEAGMEAWAEEIRRSPKMQEALMAQLHQTYDAVQEAIKKEASLMKKQAEVMWNNILMPGGDGKTTVKDAFEQAIAQLGIDQGRVSRANSLIGAGAQSERVADKLAIKQMQLQLTMQRHYYNLIEKQGRQRIKDLERSIELAKELGDVEKQKRLEQDKEHVEMSLRLALTKEQTEELKLQEDIIAKTEESQNRLYTQLKEWGDLLASGMRDVFEASNAGNADYYNELAKMNLTGKGGPGAGTYVVIENEGTEDAKAHYEYLDQRAALERQHEIEQQNAQAEAWQKLWDDLNNKMSEQITDWINASLQNQAVEENTREIRNLEQKIAEEKIKIDESIAATKESKDATIESKDATTQAASDNVGALASNTSAVIGLTQAILGKKEEKPKTDNEGNPEPSDTDVSKMATTVTDISAEEGESSVYLPGVTPGLSWTLTDEQKELVQEQTDELVQIQTDGFEKVRMAQQASFGKMVKQEGESDRQMLKSSQTTFAKMALAANMYGIAYQAMSNENLSTTQKFEMMALQAVGNYAISSLTATMSKAVAQGAVDEATVLGKLWSQLGWAAAPVFAIFTGLLGAGMAAAMSAVSKSKSQIAQATGASASAGRLATGMMTYAEGNVNEFTDPSTLTPGRQYNVDAADGRTYRARYMGSNPKTHLTNGPEFHLSGERGREMIIDAGTTRQITMNENEIWHAIQTLSAGGRMPSTRRLGRGVRAFADGNVEDFESMDNGELTMDNGGMDLAAMQASLDRNSAVQEALLERLNQPIYAQNILYGPDGLPNVIAKLQKEAQRHGEKYL